MNDAPNNLKEVFYNEAIIVAERLKQDPSSLSVILSGPLALGQASEGDKLYLAVITDKDDGVIEHHFLDDGWEEIRRPIEMGKFPLAVVRHMLNNGYTDMVSYKTLEALRCGRVLWERDNVGTQAVEGAKKHIPTEAFIGEHLHGTVSDLDDAVSLLKNGDYVNAVIVAREAATKAVRMAVKDKLEQGDTSFLQAAREILPSDQFELYLQIVGLKEIDAITAAKNADRVREFADYVLRQIGVDPEYVLGRPEKGQGA